MKVKKRDGSFEEFSPMKISNAIKLSADRCRKSIQDLSFVDKVLLDLKRRGFSDTTTVDDIHMSVENILWDLDREIYKEYRSYNNYKKRFNHSFNNILKDAKNIIYSGDKENANKNSCIVSTKRDLVSSLVGKELYLEYELPKYLADAHKEMYIYIHDAGDRLYNSINCCLFDVANVLKGGFNLNGKFIEEPSSVEKALDLLNDVILVASSQQYGGFTIPEIDTFLAKYAKMNLSRYEFDGVPKHRAYSELEDILFKKLKSIQYKIETINNANGQTAFVTWTFGADTSEVAQLITRTILRVRRHYMSIFPKLVYLYHSDISGEGKPNHELYKYAIQTSMTRMYPDFVSADDGYLNEVYNRCGTIISPMGCRAYLSPYTDNIGNERYIGRFNLGAISLMLPRYAIMSEGDKDIFFELLDKHYDYAIEVHNLTFEKMRKVKAKTNPLMFCEGGSLLKLDPEQTIEPLLECATYSIGYIGLEEVSFYMTGKHLHEDNSFAMEVLEHLNTRIEGTKKDTGKLIALYATPSEGLCDKALKADRAKFGEIPFITNKEWYHNSFHVGSNFVVDAATKQDIEYPLFHKSNGGHIMYNEYPTVDNFDAIKSMVDRAMKLGLYYGINLEIGTCHDCGFQGQISCKCPVCSSANVTGITRVCGYLGYSAQDGDTRYNEGKHAEVENRVKHFGVTI